MMRLEILGVAVIGTLTGVAAAALPARSAARLNPVAALSGRRGQIRTARKVPTIGVTLLVLGAGLAAIGSAATLTKTTSGQGVSGSSTGLLAGLVVGGSALAQIGLIVCSPALVGLAGRWSRRFPLPIRLALRDASRHRGRSAPAVAAVLTAVAGSVAVALIVVSTDAQHRHGYVASGPTGSVTVQLTPNAAVGSKMTPAGAIAALRPTLQPFTAYPVRTVYNSCPEGGPPCAHFTVVPVNDPPAGMGRLKTATAYSDELVVGEANALPIVADVPSSAARDVLVQGGLVSFDPTLVRNGRATIGYTDAAEATYGQGFTKPDAHEISVPAIFVKATASRARAIVSDALARRLHVKTTIYTVVLQPEHMPTRAQQDAANAALPNNFISVERGYQSRYGAGLLALVLGATIITVGSAGISTGLAQADARADQATLLAVGATPRVRRSLAASQALAIAGLGSLLGFISGLVPALAYVGAIDALTLVMPWGTLALLVLGIPTLAAVGAYLVTRSRLPLGRRMVA